MLEELLEGLRRRDRRALARLLSLAARGEHLGLLRKSLPVPESPGRVIAFTGSAGVGKSCLVGKLIEKARAKGKTVAVLACDPQSPLTGGALLGDRFRMGMQVDDGVFIRSLATPGGMEAIAPHLPLLVRILQTFGFDLIFLETVGAGQTDTAVSRLADQVVLLLQPETGDDLQWEKAGVLEVADVIVVHKADLPGAERTLGQVKSILELAPHRDVPLLPVSSQTGQGLGDLLKVITAPLPDRGPRDDRFSRETLSMQEDYRFLDAISFAVRAHQGQFRKDKATPYAAHPFRVGLIVRHVFGVDDPKILTAAFLHDTIEDTTTDFDDLEERYGAEIAGWVALLTKDKKQPEKQREESYLAGLNKAPWQVKVCKLADLLDNMLDSPGLPPEKKKTALERYRQYWSVFKTWTEPELKKALEVVGEFL